MSLGLDEERIEVNDLVATKVLDSDIAAILESEQIPLDTE